MRKFRYYTSMASQLSLTMAGCHFGGEQRQLTVFRKMTGQRS